MKKLLLLLVALACLIAIGCDRKDYAEHRTERAKPKVVVGDNAMFIRRAPAPNIIVLPDGRMRLDDIEIPVNDHQRELLRSTFIQLQVLRQQTLNATPIPEDKRSVKITVPAHLQPFPPALVEAVPELKDYVEAFDNLQAERK